MATTLGKGHIHVNTSDVSCVPQTIYVHLIADQPNVPQYNNDACFNHLITLASLIFIILVLYFDLISNGEIRYIWPLINEITN
jgi:hypothetical protein